MTWFRVDDSFVGHPKATGLSNDSLATWTRAGDWSAWQLTDGMVPAGLLAVFAGNAADPEACARDLVDRRLWETADDGWQFHDWADWNPTREEVLARRKQDAERRRRYLERKRDRLTGRVTNGVTEEGDPDVTRDVTRAVTDGVTRGVTRPITRAVTPARPDPSLGLGRADVSNQSSRRYAHAPAPARGPAEIIRSAFPDATDDEIDTITRTRTLNGARSVEAVLAHEVGQGTLRLPCDTAGPGRHSQACRDGNPAGCGVDWCACRHHAEPVSTTSAPPWAPPW